MRCYEYTDSKYIPKTLMDRYDGIKNIIYKDKFYGLDNESWKVFREIKQRHPFHTYWHLKCLIRLGEYTSIFKENGCSDIICMNEYSFASSILTLYCNRVGCKHINVMHGDKLLIIRDSFFHFNSFVIWDDYYKELFKELKCQIDEYLVELPEFFLISEKILNGEKFNYKYYLQLESRNQLEKISRAMKKLEGKGFKVAVRPHPIYSDMSVVKEVFQGITIEDTTVKSINESIIETEAVISGYSTVLFQAYKNNIKVIIDDISIQGAYEKLYKLKYIMTRKDVDRLSDILG